MKNYAVAVLLLALAFKGSFTYAQVSLPTDSTTIKQLKLDVSGKRIQWDAVGLKDMISGEIISSHHCYFNTEGSQRILWAQAEGRMIYSFLVKNSTQAPDEYYPERLISYDVELDDLAGRIEIFIRGMETIILVNIKSADGVTIQNEYSIAKIEIQ
jgi:hypothetical protein